MNFDIVNIIASTEFSYRKIDPSVVNFENSFKVDAYVYDVFRNNATYLTNPMIKNQQLHLCTFYLCDV